MSHMDTRVFVAYKHNIRGLNITVVMAAALQSIAYAGWKVETVPQQWGVLGNLAES